MSIRVTVELPDRLADRARAVAAQTRRPFEEVLVEWIDRAAGGEPLESLPDTELLALCDSELDAVRQEALSELLSRNREGTLQNSECEQLDELMRVYRQGLLRKAQALKTAVARGLRPRLS